MRIAVISDIHGNRTALEAVLADLRDTAPDVVFHGGDLADTGASPVEVVDRIRDLGWQGVMGNTDELLFRPESLREFAAGSTSIGPLLDTIEEMASASRAALGEERLQWLRGLAMGQTCGAVALVHASPESAWHTPGPAASDAELERAFARLASPIAVYGHVHCPFVRALPSMTVANSGSVGLSYDGDRRAAYLLLDGAHTHTPRAQVRRVEYDVEREQEALLGSGRPHAQWVARMLATASPQMP